MIFRSPDLTLNSVREVVRGKVNDVYICENTGSGFRNFYTLWVVHDHAVVKTLLEIFENAGDRGNGAYIENFAYGDGLCLVFDYEEERLLSEFYMGDVFSLQECEKVCMNLILQCITVKLPYPLLYLALTQGRIHIKKDKSIYLSYELDLEELDPSKDEGDCTGKCAEILMNLLMPKRKEKATSYRILEMKVPKNCYGSFTELYKDVKLSAAPQNRMKFRKRLKLWWLRNRDRIFRILLFICAVMAIIVIIMLVSQLFLGDIPLYRLFVNPFKTIGTQSLVQ